MEPQSISQSSELATNHQDSRVRGTPSSSKVLVSFTLFPNLPTEIRLKVWSFASNEMRNVDIWARNIYVAPVEDYSATWAPYMLYSTTEIPSVLQVSHESRNEALKCYTLDLGTDFRTHRRFGLFPAVEIKFPPQIYINWKEDRLCLMHPEDFHAHANSRGDETLEHDRLNGFVAKCKEMKLQYMAVNIQSPGWDLDHDDGIDPMFAEFLPCDGFLKEMIIFQDERWADMTSDYGGNQVRIPRGFQFEDVFEYDGMNNENKTEEWTTLCKARSKFMLSLESDGIARDGSTPDCGKKVDVAQIRLCRIKNVSLRRQS
ncbi:hypothetical protein VTL71DRAFT_9364 [Oculimacula yallundae]|uniref:2EXR domain-containing protein n=1 Tax=Oculimacula yallundae TaxID=86028 RepID=A0ABR4BSZ0_9HELO